MNFIRFYSISNGQQDQLKNMVKKGLLACLPDGERWMILSLSQSNNSKSIYVYLYNAGNIYPIRVSDHSTWFRFVDTEYFNIKVDLKCDIPLVEQIKEQFEIATAPTVKLDLPEFLILEMVYSTHEAYNPIGIFIRDNGTLTIERTNEGKPVAINNSNVYQIFEKLIKINLIKVHTNGYLSVTHNGLDILRKYKRLRLRSWPKSIREYDWWSTLHQVYLIIDSKGSHKSYSKNAKPDYHEDLDYYYELFNLKKNTSTKKEGIQAKKESPKLWRTQLINCLKGSLPYGSTLVAITSVTRKRIIYVQIMAGDLLYMVCFSSDRKECMEDSPNICILPDKISNLKKHFTKTFPLYNFRYTKVDQKSLLWLRYLQLINESKREYVINLSKENVNIEDHNHISRVLPKPEAKRYQLMVKLCWVDELNNLVSISDIGKQILENYSKTIINKSMSWNLQIQRMKLKTIENLLNI
ncbi:hypothetical protein [uncultured Limosilactobacillus sp.]|uniref:hypothetical protein n=1 Tax=uncultured Limosilactobacillus sp. TaxID=2837629 RepID=UPI0025E03B77|nr:hypothetical protein [uncultured Limosilactobacillus sp.]